MPATQRGIYHNLKESEYAVSNGEIAFFFSSELYLLKFMDRYQNNRKRFTEKIKREMDYNPLHLNLNTLADISLYKQIEKRGFLAISQGVVLDWQETQKYALRKMMLKNTTDWSRMQKPRLPERLKKA